MKNEKLFLKILSPEKTIFEGEVGSVKLPGILGSFGILPKHAPIVSSLVQGNITYQTDEGEKTIGILGGFVEMSEGSVNICISESKHIQ